MIGSDLLIQSLVANGVDVCFANPGTSEMQMVSAIDRSDAMRPILVLFEGVATGAADGYGRMAGKPACTMLHLGAGLGNGLANLHNARRARSPIVNLVGDHASYHLQYDAPLTSDVAGVARPMSDWVETVTSAEGIGASAAAAVSAARTPPGAIATLIVPGDYAWSEVSPVPAPHADIPERPAISQAAISAAVEALRSGEPCVLLAADLAVHAEGLALIGRIAAATGVRPMIDTLCTRSAGGTGRVRIERLAYFGEMALEQIKGTKHLITVGTKAPVAFFAYPGKPSSLVPEGCAVIDLAPPGSDVLGALAEIADAVGAPASPPMVNERVMPDAPSGAINPAMVYQAIARAMPEGAVIADESGTSGMAGAQLLPGSAPHDILQITGGSIGYGLPAAVGAAVACPDRKIICPHGDGGAMYTIQSLWTMARENLDVTTIIFSNRSYGILNIELRRTGESSPGPKALSMLDLTNPELDFVSIAKGMGVDATRVTTGEEMTAAFERSMREPGPFLIDVALV